MTLSEEKDFVSNMLFDFKISLAAIRKEPLADYEIELILERYCITESDLKKILEKIYNKTLSGIRPMKNFRRNNVRDYI